MQPWIDLIQETWRVQNETRDEVLRHFETAGAAWQQPAVLQAQALLWERMWAALESNLSLWSAWLPPGLLPAVPTLCPPSPRRAAAAGDAAPARPAVEAAEPARPARRAPRAAKPARARRAPARAGR